MAIIWWTDFEGIDQNSIAYLAAETASLAISSAARPGMTGNYLQIAPQTAEYATRCIFLLPQPRSEGLLSFAWMYSTNTLVDTRSIFQLRAANIIHLQVRMNADATLSLFRGSTLLSTSSRPFFFANQRHRVEFGFLLHATNGLVCLKIDGVTVFDLTDISTINTASGSGTVDRFSFTNLRAGSGTIYVDDIWFDTDRTAFIGDVTIESIALSADVSGVSLRSSGDDRYALIVEKPIATDSYLTFESVGDDIFEHSGTAGEAESVVGVGLTCVAQTTAIGTSDFRIGLGHATERTMSDALAIDSTPVYVSSFHPVNPSTDDVWILDDVDEATVIMRRES